MPIFLYTAIASGSGPTSGEIEARSRPEALRALEQRALQVVSLRVRETGEPASAATPLPSRHAAASADPSRFHLSRAQIILFTEELADLLDAGLQLEPALRAMGQRQELRGIGEVVAVLRDRVTEGIGFSTALRTASPSFGDLYTNMAAAGEMSGSLAKILRRQAKYLQTMDDLQSRVLQAFVYPSFVFGAGAVLIIVFMTYLVPQLTKLLTETGKELPLATRILIAISDFLGVYGLWMLAAALIGGAFFVTAIQQPEGRLRWDRAKLRLPLIGAVLTARLYAQFSQTLGNLVGNGIPLLNALRLMGQASDNAHFTHLLKRILNLVGDGGSFTRAMRTVGDFPPLFVDIVAVGEQTGDLPAALEKAAIRYERELSRRIERMTGMIQPLVIVVMALMVGAVAYSMITGIFQTITGLRVH